MADGDAVSGSSEKCQPCSRKGRENDGVQFCDTCQTSFCPACLVHHDEIFDHLQKQDPDSIGRCTATKESTELCEEHKMPITLYCNEEDKIGCVTCMDDEHKSCKQLIYLPAAAKALLMDTDLEQLIEMLRQTMHELESIKRKQQPSLSSLVADNEQCIQEVTDLYTRLLASLSTIFKSTTESIKQTFDYMRDELGKHIQNVEDCLTDLAASTSRLQQFRDNNTQLFIEVRKCRNRLKTAEEVSVDASDNLKTDSMCVVIDHRLNNLLIELDTLANVVQRKAIEVKKKHSINVRACGITSTCIVKDGSILAVDQTNKRVKHLDGQTLNNLETLAMENLPIGVCCIGDDKAVVTCANNQIVLISIYPRLSITRSINLNHQCGYVGYNNGELFITDIGRTLYVYSLNGSLQRKIKFQSGQYLFSEARHVTINDTGDKVCVADWENGLVVINRDGVVLDKLDNNKLTLNRTWGVCFDDVGGVFACDLAGNKVVYVDHKGHVVDILTSADGLTHPRSVCYDRKNRRLLVSQKDSNDLMVCELL